jgi:hypothetical protein
MKSEKLKNLANQEFLCYRSKRDAVLGTNLVTVMAVDHIPEKAYPFRLPKF